MNVIQDLKGSKSIGLVVKQYGCIHTKIKKILHWNKDTSKVTRCNICSTNSSTQIPIFLISITNENPKVTYIITPKKSLSFSLHYIINQLWVHCTLYMKGKTKKLFTSNIRAWKQPEGGNDKLEVGLFVKDIDSREVWATEWKET